MPWGVAAAAVTAGAGMASSASASRSQQRGADAATAEQRRQYDTTRSDNQTALDARNTALARMQELAGTFGSGPTAEQVMATPGYQFGLNQGRASLEGSAAARGGLYSGAAGKALTRYGTDYATTKYDDSLNNLRNSQNDQFNRYASLSDKGQLGANAINAAGQNMANSNSATLQNNANAQGAAAISQGNALTNGVNQAASWWNNRPQSTAGVQQGANYQGNGGVMQSGQNYNYGDVASGWAEGGPVQEYALGGQVGFGGARLGMKPPSMFHAAAAPMAWQGGMNMPSAADMQPPMQQPMRPWMGSNGYADGGRVEPKVGTKAEPKRGGTAGGLMDLLVAPVPQKPDTSLGQLPANFLTKPKAILADREERANFLAGGAVSGPGGPTEDAIPAKLSNGEHVVTAAEITSLGEGSNEIGQMRMAHLRKMMKGMC